MDGSNFGIDGDFGSAPLDVTPPDYAHADDEAGIENLEAGEAHQPNPSPFSQLVLDLLDAVPMPALEVWGSTAAVLRANSSADALLETYCWEEQQEKHFLDILSYESQETMRQALEQVLSGNPDTTTANIEVSLAGEGDEDIIIMRVTLLRVSAAGEDNGAGVALLIARAAPCPGANAAATATARAVAASGDKRPGDANIWASVSSALKVGRGMSGEPGVVTEWDDKLVKGCQVPKPEAVGRSCLKHSASDCQKIDDDALADAGAPSVEVRLRRCDGTLTEPLVVSISARYNPKSEFVGWLCIGQIESEPSGATDETTTAQPPSDLTPGSGADALVSSAAQGVVAVLAPASVAPAAGAAAEGVLAAAAADDMVASAFLRAVAPLPPGRVLAAAGADAMAASAPQVVVSHLAPARASMALRVDAPEFVPGVWAMSAAQGVVAALAPAPVAPAAGCASEGVLAVAAVDAMAIFLGLLSQEQRAHGQSGGPKRLYLERMGLDSRGAWFIADALRYNKTLVTIRLWGNEIGDEGAQSISKALQENNTLQTIVLSDNNIGALGAQFLSDALKLNASLKEIWLDRNQIGNAGARALAEALKMNSTLTRIELEANNIGPIGAGSLAEAIMINGTLKYISLTGKNIGPEGQKALNRASRPGLKIRY